MSSPLAFVSRNIEISFSFVCASVDVFPIYLRRFFLENMEAMGGFISRKTWNVGRMGRKEKERTSNSNKNTTEKETHPKYVGKSDKTPSESNNDK